MLSPSRFSKYSRRLYLLSDALDQKMLAEEDFACLLEELRTVISQTLQKTHRLSKRRRNLAGTSKLCRFLMALLDLCDTIRFFQHGEVVRRLQEVEGRFGQEHSLKRVSRRALFLSTFSHNCILSAHIGRFWQSLQRETSSGIGREGLAATC